jgi:hypothetical protein
MTCCAVAVYAPKRSEGGSEGGWITFRTKCGSRGTAHRTRAVSNREVLSSTMTLSVQHRHGVRLAGPAVAVGFSGNREPPASESNPVITCPQ